MKSSICGYFATIVMVSIQDIVSTGKTTVTIIGKSGKTSNTSPSLKHCVIPSADNTIYRILSADKEQVTLSQSSTVRGDGTVVHVECIEVKGSTVGPRWFGQDYMVCYNGEWYPPGNVCMKVCPPLNFLHNSLFKCTLNHEPVSCKEHAQPHTVAEKICKPGHHDSYAVRDSQNKTAKNVCLDTGKWSFQFSDCFAACDGEGIDKGFKSNNTDLMELVASFWIAGVYRWDNVTGNFVLVCSATIVSTDVVVTAARCVQDNRKALSTGLVRVALGKSYSSWNDERDIYSQTFEVTRITDDITHSSIAALGALNKDSLPMLESMSFLFLKGRPEFDPFVRALCTNIDGSNTEVRYLNGTVTGWDDKTGKRVSYRTIFYKQADCRNMISKLEEHDEELENEIMKLGNYCTDKVFPASFLGTAAVFYNDKERTENMVGILTGMYKSFSIFVGLRTKEAIKSMMGSYKLLIDFQRRMG